MATQRGSALSDYCCTPRVQCSDETEDDGKQLRQTMRFRLLVESVTDLDLLVQLPSRLIGERYRRPMT